MHYIADELRSRNIEPLKIRNDLHLKCTNAPLPKITTTPKPITTIGHNCNNKVPLETTTKTNKIPMYSYHHSKISPPQETLEDVNLYCQLLENAFKRREQPPPTISKYSNEEKLHFTDNPLLKPEPTLVPHVIPKPCKKEIIYTPKPPSYEPKQEQVPNVDNFYKLISILSSPVVKPLKNSCPNEHDSYLNENPLKKIVNEEMNNPLMLNNYQNTDSKVMQYLNMFPNNLKYSRSILRHRRSNLDINRPEVNFADEVSERLPIEEFSVNHRIIGGTLAHSKEVPYQVALYNLDYFICGSSLISKFYILTAGHCLDE